MDREEDWVRAFRATLPELWAFVARRAGGDRALSEDVVQESWLRAVQSWREQGFPREPVAWLKTTAANLLRNHFRDRRRKPLARNGVDLDALLKGGCNAKGDELLQQGLARLPTAEAELLEAFHLDGRSTRELAAERRLSERAIEGRLHRARNRLRSILAASNGEHR